MVTLSQRGGDAYVVVLVTGILMVGPSWHCSGPGGLDPCLSGVLRCRCFLSGSSSIGARVSASLPVHLARRRPDGLSHGSPDLRPFSPGLPALLDAVAPGPPHDSPHCPPYPVRLKASSFCWIQCSWVWRQCHLPTTGAAPPTPS